MEPIRVQRKRVKGWKMPENTLSVTRPGKWGNPFRVEEMYRQDGIMLYGVKTSVMECVETLIRNCRPAYELKSDAVQASINCFEIYITGKDLSVLKGKNLACFCLLENACHADILLELANK